MPESTTECRVKSFMKLENMNVEKHLKQSK